MSTTFLWILISTLFVSLGSLVGIFTLALQESKLNKILLLLVSLSAGALTGGAFIHLLPEAAEKMPAEQLFTVVLVSFISFFFLEKLLHWHHCHAGDCENHTFGYMNLIGDSIHNFIDGLVLAGAYMTDFRLGIAATLAVAMHEIPQEIGDFGVLLYSGFAKMKALIANFLVALTIVLGGIIGYFFTGTYGDYLLPFAAGGFIYIAASDLMPEIRTEKNLNKSVLSFGIFLAGVLLMWLVKQLEF